MRLPRLPRPHPADVPAVTGQTVSVLMVGGLCAWMTYGAAQTWAWLPGWSGPAVAAAGGVSGAVATLGGLLYARLAGQQDARRVLQGHQEAQARNRAERGQQAEPVRYPSTVGGRHRSVGRWAEPNDQAAIAGRRVLDNAAARRFELPAGVRGGGGDVSG